MKTRWQYSILVMLLFALARPAAAQWLDKGERPPSRGIPRTADGKPNLTAPVSRTPDGKPDLSGIWLGARWANLGVPALSGVREAPNELNKPPFQPWAEELFNQRKSSNGADDPEARCLPQGVPKAGTLPYPFEIINAPGK